MALCDGNIIDYKSMADYYNYYPMFMFIIIDPELQTKRIRNNIPTSSGSSDLDSSDIRTAVDVTHQLRYRDNRGMEILHRPQPLPQCTTNSR
jgi:hypothetical protein